MPEQEALLSQAAAVHGLLLPPTAARRGLASAGAWWQQQTAQRPLAQRDEVDRRKLYQEFDAQVLAAAGFDLDPGTTEAIFTTLLELGRSSHLEVFDDAAPALDDLKAAGYAMGVISNMDPSLRLTLESFDLAPYFSVILSSEEAGIAKPSPVIFTQAASLSGLPPSAIVYVGDQPEIDVPGAQAAGMQAALVDRAGVFTTPPDCWRLSTLAELPGRLSQG